MQLLAYYSFGAGYLRKARTMEKDTKIPEKLKGCREPVSAARKGTLCAGASIPPSQAAAWQCPSSGKQQTVPRALQPSLPFQINSSHPRP